MYLSILIDDLFIPLLFPTVVTVVNNGLCPHSLSPHLAVSWFVASSSLTVKHSPALTTLMPAQLLRMRCEHSYCVIF